MKLLFWIFDHTMITIVMIKKPLFWSYHDQNNNDQQTMIMIIMDHDQKMNKLDNKFCTDYR